MENLPRDQARKDIGTPPSLSPPIQDSISGRQYSCIVKDAIVEFSDEANDSTKYEADIDKYLPLLTPKLTKAGKIAVHQPSVPKKLLKWWKVQCGFRGLSVSGNLRDLQNRIREQKMGGLSKTMKEACEKMEKEYVTNNNRAIEEIWIQADDNQKVKLWPKRFLYESFMEHPKLSRKTLVVEVDGWGETIEKVSQQMKIHYEMRKMPDHRTGQRSVVVGRNEQLVRSKAAEMDRDIQRSVQRARQEQEIREQEAQEDFDRRFKLAQSQGKGSKKEWKVSGEWDISCPYMEEQWGSEDNGCDLEIKITKSTEIGLVQMFASFNFIALAGIMRFINQSAKEDARDEDKESRSSEDDSNYESEVSSSDDGSVPARFLFPKSSLPSSKARDFVFRWRGEETGEGEIQPYSDEDLCSMTFESPNALSGFFISGLTGKIEFKGIRHGSKTKTEEAAGWPDPSDEWHSRNKAAYQYMSISRWN